jgi:hypothetical protein
MLEQAQIFRRVADAVGECYTSFHERKDETRNALLLIPITAQVESIPYFLLTVLFA